MVNVLACSQAENLILCLCPLQLKWSERQENMRVSLNLFSSIFFTIYFVLVYKSKKSILLDNVSRAELIQACVWYAKCELRNWLRTCTRARTLSQIFRVTDSLESFPEWHIIFKLYIHNFLISVSIPMKAEYSNRNHPHKEWNCFIWLTTARIWINMVQISHLNCVKW